MNKLVIIGNGFDLAHGLKTRYEDFIIWYLSNVYQQTIKEHFYEDNLIKASTDFSLLNPTAITSLAKFQKAIKDRDIEVEYKYNFFKKLINNVGKTNWVDIESFYYDNLVVFYKILESKPKKDWEPVFEEIINLNNCFDVIKEKLIEYLKTINTKELRPDSRISSYFDEDLQHDENKADSVVYLLNFNYTSTINLYKNIINYAHLKINFIHGSLYDEKNPIIFGYGDEMDEFYTKIERINENELLRNIKSFEYFKTNNYQNFSNFIDTDRFNAYIMGHSCGLSDRILLNSIFEHQNCNKVFIYYHQKQDGSDDYVEKIMEISRHFKPESKGVMRTRISSYPDSKPLNTAVTV